MFNEFSGRIEDTNGIASLLIFAILFMVIFALAQGLVKRLAAKRRARLYAQHDNVAVFKPRQKIKKKKSLLIREKAKQVLPLFLIGIAVVFGVMWSMPELNVLQSRETFTGMVTHVRDGDTIEVSGIPIRLNGLTCDELGTPLGQRGKSEMLALVSGKSVTCTLNGDTTYDRQVGRCELLGGRDIGEEMIRSGVCGRCARYDPLRTYAKAQSEAGPFQGSYPSYCYAPW